MTSPPGCDVLTPCCIGQAAGPLSTEGQAGAGGSPPIMPSKHLGRRVFPPNSVDEGAREPPQEQRAGARVCMLLGV